MQLTAVAYADALMVFCRERSEGVWPPRPPWSVEVVEVLPLPVLVAEHLGGVDHDAFEESVQLLGVDPV